MSFADMVSGHFKLLWIQSLEKTKEALSLKSCLILEWMKFLFLLVQFMHLGDIYSTFLHIRQPKSVRQQPRKPSRYCGVLFQTSNESDDPHSPP